MNKIWSRVFENNYHKSLDHRSFYFKQVRSLLAAQKASCQNAGVSLCLASPCWQLYNCQCSWTSYSGQES